MHNAHGGQCNQTKPLCTYRKCATQNPVDQEGTYPLPEAQVDRFMMKVHVKYPSKEEELEVMRRMSNMSFKPELKTILSKKDIFAIQEEINAVSLSESLEKYIVELVLATRDPQSYQLDDMAHYIQFGASPRASINLNLAAKAVAFFLIREILYCQKTLRRLLMM